jgi:hypothetical protein
MGTWVMGVGLRPSGKPLDKPPNPATVAHHSSIPIKDRDEDWPLAITITCVGWRRVPPPGYSRRTRPPD